MTTTFSGADAVYCMVPPHFAEATLIGIIQNIEHEYHVNIDKFSQSIIIAQMELFLTYAERFYHRQFITRKISFEHPQSFSKLFKTKTNLSPLEFRQSFN